jgi:hypothetical protein
VLDAAVTRHEVHQDLDAETSCAGEQRVEVVEAAVLVVDVEVVGNVVAVVVLRRRVARVEPDGLDAKRRDVVES